MSLPLIGLTTARSDKSAEIPVISTTEAYVRAVIKAGGLPVLIPVGLQQAHLTELVHHLQGVIFTGGGDVDPALFAGEPHPKVYGIDPMRDALEITLVHLVVESSLPFLAICRGIQVVNVALGGKLYTDVIDQLPTSILHPKQPENAFNHITHTVEVKPANRLSRIVKAQTLPVNSLHHQGISVVAPSLIPVAYAPDGLVEGVELPNAPFGLGVQWHPEWLPDEPQMQAIFSALVTAANQRNLPA